MEHIAETPGYPDGSWPREMTRDENRADLQRHADDFHNRKGFTYTVLDPGDRDVIGCVYIYPLPDSDSAASVLSWVRKSHAHLDTPLWRAVTEWLESDWPFATVEYARRAWFPGSRSDRRDLRLERCRVTVWEECLDQQSLASRVL